MGNKLGIILRRIVFAFCIIYGINVVIKATGICLPINIATLATTILLGIPGLISLFVIFYIIT